MRPSWMLTLVACLALTRLAGAYDISGTVRDTAGAPLAQAKVWLLDDSTESVLTDAQGRFRLVGGSTGLRPLETSEEKGLGLDYGSAGLFLKAPRAMALEVRVVTVNGTEYSRAANLKVAAGRTRMEKLVGRLPFGVYAVSVSGPGVSLAFRLVQGRAPTSGLSAPASGNGEGNGEPARALAKASATDSGALSGIVASRADYAPMLHVPATALETGVTITLKKPLRNPGHIIVIYLENWSFDATYGQFPGAEGLTEALAADPQRDTNGVPYSVLPRPWNSTIFPANLPNRAFPISDYLGLNKKTPGDLVHAFYQEQLEINGTKMDQYAAVSDARGGVMGYFPTDSLKVASWAKQYTLFDHFFHSAFGGSYLNHQWLIASRTPLWTKVPASYKATVDPVTGKIKKTGDRSYADGISTPDGYIVNTAYSVNTPHPGTSSVPTNKLVPSLTYATIGDRMNDKGVTWAWYGGGWANAAAGNPSSGFPYHHHPFAYFANYAQGTPGRAAHLKDASTFWADLRNGAIPQVSFYKPDEVEDEHPKNSDMKTGDLATSALLDSIKASPIWNDVVVIVTYDEHGGFHDHVPPPVIDRWGPGTRIPAMMISPLARKGYVDKHVYETVSILALIERRFSLVPLTSRDAAAGDMTTALELP